MKGVTLMGKGYTLAGEAFFREMMRPEEERRQRAVSGNRSSDIGGGSYPPNVVSFREYKQRQAGRRPYRVVSLKS
jgi:hypothetical protein